MYFEIFLYLHTSVNADDIIQNVTENLSIHNIADTLVTLLDTETKNNRIDELKHKLEKINEYTINIDKLAQLLTNETSETNLNETNFFKALHEDDHFGFLTVDEPKNLYLKLKEKINRDDVLKILSERDTKGKLIKSARKVMSNNRFGRNYNDILNDIVDKMIAETPSDNHKYDVRDNESIYWDPQRELEDLQEYHRHDGRRIYKGERTTIRFYPFMVSIHVMGRFWCGGVIYWHDLVLTSAACLQLMHNNRFFRENPKVLQVRIGSNHSRIGGEIVDALEVFFHPGYNPKTLRNNIAVIRLRRHLYFNYHRIPKIIQIDHSSLGLPATAEVLILGWGVTKSSQRLAYEPIFIQRKFLPLYPSTFCKEVYGDKFITSTMFCAGTLTTGEGACDHDAGGPAILSGRLVGIISFGPTVCGYPNAPTVFTLVGAYSDWIETINETMPGYYRGKARTTTTTRSPLIDYFDTWATTTTSRPSGLDPLMHAMGGYVTTPQTAEPTTAVASPTLRHGRLYDTDANDEWNIYMNK